MFIESTFSTTVSWHQRGRTQLKIPRLTADSCGRTHWDSVDWVGVPITITIVHFITTIPWCPYEDATSTFASLKKRKCVLIIIVDLCTYPKIIFFKYKPCFYYILITAMTRIPLW